MARPKLKNIKATICILTYNGEEYIDELLRMIEQQKTDFEYETLVIDSGSVDRTVETVKSHSSVRLHEIPNKQFGHGKTRNLGAELAKGDYIVYITQDAVPENEQWLSFMLEPFMLNDKVLCVFGRQAPRSDCIASVKREVTSVFKSLGEGNSLYIHRGSTLDDKHRFSSILGFFSDVNSAVRKDLLLHKVPYKEVAYAEDQVLGIDTLKAGYLKVYTPLGSVIHSHSYPIKKYFHRKYDEYAGLKKSTGHTPKIGPKRVLIIPPLSTSKDWWFILNDQDYSALRKISEILKAPFYNIALLLAEYLASKEISSSKKAKLSLEERQKSKT